MQVYVPFKDGFKEAMLCGVKTATSRTRKYGNQDDTFTAFGVEFKITDVSVFTLDSIATHLWKQEGCGSKEQFKRIWTQLHPVAGFQPDQRVWVHRFRRTE